MDCLRILVVEDDEDDFLLLRQMLQAMEGARVLVGWARTCEEADALLGGEWDAALIDYRLGGRDGLQLVRTHLARARCGPMILLTGVGDRALDLLAMEAGVADYLVKGEVTPRLLERSLRHAMARKAAESALRESEARLEHSVSLLRATLDASFDGIVVTDPRGTITECSRSFKSLWGLPESATVGDVTLHLLRSVWPLTKNPRQFAAQIRRIRSSPEMVSDDVLELEGGRCLERHSRPQRNGDAIVGRVWCFRDVTEERKLQASLLASDRLASMGALASGVAHEINNPLTYLLANLTVLAEELPLVAAAVSKERAEMVAEMLADARHGAERVRVVVRELKVFSRTDDVSIGPVDLQVVLGSAINMAFSEFRYRARLVKEYGADVPLVEGNEGKLSQIFLNLLIHAAHALPEGPLDQNHIRVVTRTDDRGWPVVEIHDNGAGISPEQVAEIFLPFSAAKPSWAGSGLGLSLSLASVRALGGTLEVESEVGRGSTFRVILPAAIPATSEPSSWAPIPPADAGPRGRVLVVDGDRRVATVIGRVLGHAHDVIVATSATEALARITRGETFDLILCDLNALETTGRGLHAQLSARNSSAVEVLVFMTGGTFTRGAGELLERAANEPLDKPIDPSALRAVVRRLLLRSSTRALSASGSPPPPGASSRATEPAPSSEG
jgi:signal transduction histidine kinase/CheY-like chemotaxis protein